MPRLVWTPDIPLWHGGVPGLKVGDVIRPASEIGDKSSDPIWRDALKVVDSLTDSRAFSNNRVVYVSLNRGAALEFACVHPSFKGCVYEVEPLGDLHPDPDCYDGSAWTCASAKVLGVYPVSPTTRRKVLEVGRKQDQLQTTRLGMPKAVFDRVHVIDPAQGRDDVQEAAARLNARLRRRGL